jgi:hypothetical protein
MEVDLSSIMVQAKEETYDDFEDNVADEPDFDPEPVTQEPEAKAKEGKKQVTDADQRELAIQIRQCLEEFPEKLSALKKTKIEGKSMEELQKIWSEIEYMMGAKQNLKMAVGGAITAVKTVEDLVSEFTPLKIQGLYQICNDPEVLDDIKFICIKSTSKMSTMPEQRLGMRFLITAFALHRINSSMMPAPVATQAATEIIENDPKFAQL